MRREAGILAILGVCGAASAQSLFEVSVDAVDPSVADMVVGGSSVPDLVQGLLDTEGAFASFEGEAFSASLRYAGVDDAITFTLSSDGNTATLDFVGRDEPPLVFTATADQDVEDQIIDFLEQNGGDVVSDFLNEINELSLVAVTDGNPQSTTAQMGSYKFRRFGQHQDLTRLERRIMRGEVVEPVMPGAFRASGWSRQAGQAEQQGGGMRSTGSASGFGLNEAGTRQDGAQGGGQSGAQGDQELDAAQTGTAQVQWFQPGSDRGLRVRLDAIGGIADADGIDSEFIQVASSYEYRFNRFWGVAASFPLSYYNVEDADVFLAGAHLDIPIRLIQQHDGKGFTFQITPGALIVGSGSFELISGGLFWGVGGTALASYEVGDWIFSGSGSFTHFESITLQIDEFEFDPDLSQDFVRVGGKATYGIGDNAYVFAGLSYSDFIDDAAVDNYLSPSTGIGLRTANGFNFRLAYEGDFGDNYEAHKIQAGVQLPF
ncbi:MAG: hypothetical protein AAFX79_08780 [Planctomycetota bacterium]